jgi:DNA-binding winged helix-turn-helix (wHTH) protein
MDASAPGVTDGRRRFGVFEFDLRTGELSKDGRLVALRPQAQRLLGLLVASPGEVVSRSDIQQALWSGDTFVDFDQGVNHAIRELRAALGDVADAPRFIQTLPRRGYRRAAPRAVVRGVDAATTQAEASPSHDVA